MSQAPNYLNNPLYMGSNFSDCAKNMKFEFSDTYGSKKAGIPGFSMHFEAESSGKGPCG